MRSVLLSIILCAVALPAQSQSYPAKSIRLVSPYAPGGGSDILARTIGQKLAENLGVSVVVDNRPGAGGVIGTEIVAKAPPDGYTIMLGTPSPLTVAPHLYAKLSYDPLKDLAPVTLISIVPAVWTAHPSLPVKSIRELLQLAKAKPGHLAYSSSGNGGTAHLAGEMLKTMAGIELIHVPYKGTGPAMTAIISGEVSLGCGNIISSLPYVKSGRVRALAVTTPKRSPVLPEVPAVAETIPGYAAGPFYGVLAPGGTPADIVQKLHGEIARILRTPEMKSRLSSEGGEPIGGGPEEFAALLRTETVRWGRVVRQAGMRSE